MMSLKNEKQCHKVIKKQSNIGKHETFDGWNYNCKHRVKNSQVNIHPTKAACLRQTNVFCSPICGFPVYETEKKLSYKKAQPSFNISSFKEVYNGSRTSKVGCKLSSQKLPVCKKPLLHTEYPLEHQKLVKQKDQANLDRYGNHCRFNLFTSNVSSVLPTQVFSGTSELSQYVDGTNIKTPCKSDDHAQTTALPDDSDDLYDFSVYGKSRGHSKTDTTTLNVPKLSFQGLEVLSNALDSDNVLDSDSHSPILRVRDLEPSNFTDLDHQPHKLGSDFRSEKLAENDEAQKSVVPNLAQIRGAKSEKEILDFVNGNCTSSSKVFQRLFSSKTKSNDITQSVIPEVSCDFEDTTVSCLPVLRVHDLESTEALPSSFDSHSHENQLSGTTNDNTIGAFSSHETPVPDPVQKVLYYSPSLETSDLSSSVLNLDYEISSNVMPESLGVKTAKSPYLQKTVHFDLSSPQANSIEISYSSCSPAVMLENDFLKKEESTLSSMIDMQSNTLGVVALEDLYSDDNDYKTVQNEVDNSREVSVSSTLHVASSCDPSMVIGNIKGSASKVNLTHSLSNYSVCSTTPQEISSPNTSAGISTLKDVELQACEAQGAVISMESFVDTTSEDEEDILHTSINHLSFNSAHLVPLGVSLRLLRLHRILRDVDQNVKEDLMRKYRCFFKWRKNARLNRLLKQSYAEKLQRAEVHYQSKLLACFFHSWSMHTRETSFLADSLHKNHMLAKGIKALKWLMIKCKERDVWLNRRRNFLTMKRMFMEWRHTFHFHRERLLRQSFERWKIQHRHSVVLNIVLKQKARNKLIQCYCSWRSGYQQRNLESIALSFYCTNLKRKAFQAWIVFVADCDVRRNQGQISVQYMQYKLLTQCLRRWTAITTRMLVARQHFRGKVLRQRFCEWRKSVDHLKLRHRKQASAARQLRLRQLIKRTWNIWTSELKAIRLYNRNRHQDLRTILNVWKFETAMKLHYQVLSDEFQRKTLLQRTVRQWKESCVVGRTKRLAAAVHLQRFVLRRILTAWCEVVNEKKMIQEKLTSFWMVQNKMVQRRGFLIWKSLFYRILVERDARNQWSRTCAQRAASKWKDFVKRKAMARTCKRMAVKVRKNDLKVCFEKWKKKHGIEEEKSNRADALFGALSQRKTARVFRNWHQLAQDSYYIRPFVTTRERKHRTRVFDAWRGVLLKKHTLQDRFQMVKDGKTKAIFGQWRREFEKRKIVEEALRRKQENKTLKIFQSWNKYAQRQRSFYAVTRSRTDDVIRSCYCHWKTRVLTRRLAEEEKLLHEIHNHRILTKAFARWKREVLCEKMLREDNVSWFTEYHNLNLKTSAFKRWKISLHHRRLAKQFMMKKLLVTASICLKKWHVVTQNAMQEQSDSFCASLRARSSVLYGDFSPVDASLSSWIHCGSLDSDLHFQPRLLHHNNDGSQASSPDPSRGLFGDQATNSDSGLDLLKDVHSDSSTTSSRQQIKDHVPASHHSGDCARICSTDSAIPYDVSMTCADLITHGVMSVDLADFQTLEVDHFYEHSIETDGKMTVRDLTGEEMDSSSIKSCSSESEELITERRVEESTKMHSLLDVRATSDNSNAWSATDEDFSASLTEPHKVVAPARPKHGFQVVAQEYRLEKLVRFAASRLSSPSLSRAFFQWKLLSHAAQWDKTMRKYAQRQVEDRRLKQYVLHWRNDTRRLHLSKKHYKRALLFSCVQSWKDWIVRKQSMIRMKSQASSKNNRRLTSWCLGQWLKAHHRRIALEAILKYWKSRVPDRSQMTEKSLAMQTKYDSALLQRCLNSWKLRLNQLKECDVYRNRILTQRSLRHWCDYFRQKATERQEVDSIRKKLTMRRTVHTWSRALRTHENIEQMRLRCLKTWLASLIVRWQCWAESESDKWARYDCFVDLRRKETMKQQFALWRHKASLRLLADRSRDRAILYKCVISWRRIVVVNKIETKQLKSLTMERNRLGIFKCFESWKSAYSIRLVEDDFKAKKQKKLWKRWQYCLQIRRAEQLGRSVTLRRFLIAWLSAHEEEKKSQEISRRVVTKWRAMALRHRQCQATAYAFAQRSSNALKAAAFNKWLSTHKRTIEADNFHQQQKVKKAFFAWRSLAANDTRLRRLATTLKSVNVERKLISSWLRWRNATARCICLDQLLVEFQRTKQEKCQLQAWLLWKRSLDVAKAREFQKIKLKNKVFSYWHQAYENRQSAITFDLLRTKAVLREHFISWHQVVTRKKRMLTQVSDFKVFRNRRITSSYYAEWRVTFLRLTMATNQSTMSMKRHALQRWVGYLKQRKIHQHNNERAMAINQTSMLKGCLSIWKHYHQAIQDNYFVADELLCRHRFELQETKWLRWKSALNQRLGLLRRTRLIEQKVVDKWRQFTDKRIRQSAVESFQQQVAKRRSFNRWKENYKTRLFTRKRHHVTLKKCILAWQSKVSCALFAHRYYDYKAVMKAWTAWRLRYASANATNQSWDEMKHDLLMMTFQSWKTITQKKRKLKEKNVLEIQSRIPRLKRK